MWYNENMHEDNVVKIIVAIIALLSAFLGGLLGYIGKSKKQSIEEAKHEQSQSDLFERLITEMKAIKQRLDTHNKYAEKFGEIEISLASIKKDIEYLRKVK